MAGFLRSPDFIVRLDTRPALSEENILILQSLGAVGPCVVKLQNLTLFYKRPPSLIHSNAPGEMKAGSSIWSLMLAAHHHWKDSPSVFAMQLCGDCSIMTNLCSVWIQLDSVPRRVSQAFKRGLGGNAASGLVFFSSFFCGDWCWSAFKRTQNLDST